MISNGLDHFVCEYDWDNKSFKFKDSIPEFNI